MYFRITLIVIICFVCSIVAQAQINRNVLGMTVGSTTKSQAVATLHKNADNNGSEITLENIQYEGYTWDKCVLLFVNDKLAEVSMWSNTKSARSRFINLTKTLGEKYYAYGAHFADGWTYFNYGGVRYDIRYYTHTYLFDDQIGITITDIQLRRQKKN